MTEKELGLQWTKEQEEYIARLKAQIEKMKCCANCKWYRIENGGETFCDCVGDCIDFSSWELVE